MTFGGGVIAIGPCGHQLAKAMIGGAASREAVFVFCLANIKQWMKGFSKDTKILILFDADDCEGTAVWKRFRSATKVRPLRRRRTKR